jgi:hypothetical protein
MGVGDVGLNNSVMMAVEEKDTHQSAHKPASAPPMEAIIPETPAAAEQREEVHATENKNEKVNEAEN